MDGGPAYELGRLAGSLLCCLLVLAVIGGAIALVLRGRARRRPPLGPFPPGPFPPGPFPPGSYQPPPPQPGQDPRPGQSATDQ